MGGDSPGGDTSAADIEATQGAGYGFGTTSVDDNPVDDSTDISGLSGNQGLGNEISGSRNQESPDEMDQDVSVGLNTISQSNLSQAAIDSARTDRSQSPDSQSFFASNAVPDAMDFNFANSQAAQGLIDRAKQGSFPNAFTPLGAAINALSKIGPQSTLNNLNRGQVPTFTGSNITGTTGQGFGMASPTGVVPGYDAFSPVTPTTNINTNMNDDGGGNEQTLIRRNPNDPVDEREEERPPISDDLAVNYLQNPFYLYSGQGNLYQPYGYAGNTLVDLLRTRNLTQPQQAAANLGLFGNPGDFV
jgi:hypothetical protein